MSNNRVALWAFLGNVVLASGNAVGIRFMNRELDPIWGAGLRFSLAAVLFGITMAVMRLAMPHGRDLRGALLYGLFGYAGAFGFAFYALVQIHAGLGQVILALVPLSTLLLAVVQRQERLTVSGVIGTVLAVAGIAVISGGSAGGAIPLTALLATLASALCFSQGAIIARKYKDIPGVTMNTVAMGSASVLLIALSLALGETIALPREMTTWLATGYLVIVGSYLTFLLYLIVLEHWAASRAAYVFVILPVFTVAISVLLDDEQVGGGLVLGGILVAAGVYLGALRPARVVPDWV